MVKVPATRLAMRTVNVISVFSWTFSPLAGLTMTAETMFPVEGISPMADGMLVSFVWDCAYGEFYVRIPLQEPPWTCRPLVMVLPSQMLMKLAGSLGTV